MIRLVTLLLAFAASIGVANAQSDLVKRGDYLVNGILTCGNCHTPKGPPAAIAGKEDGCRNDWKCTSPSQSFNCPCGSDDGLVSLSTDFSCDAQLPS